MQWPARRHPKCQQRHRRRNGKCGVGRLHDGNLFERRLQTERHIVSARQPTATFVIAHHLESSRKACQPGLPDDRVHVVPNMGEPVRDAQQRRRARTAAIASTGEAMVNASPFNVTWPEDAAVIPKRLCMASERPAPTRP